MSGVSFLSNTTHGSDGDEVSSVPSPAPQSSSPVLCCRDVHESDDVGFLLNHLHYHTHTGSIAVLLIDHWLVTYN